MSFLGFVDKNSHKSRKRSEKWKTRGNILLECTIIKEKSETPIRVQFVSRARPERAMAYG